MVYNIVVSIFVRAAHKPADDEHPYGHTQFESVGALVVGAFIITTAVTIFWDSIDSLFDFFKGTSEFTGSASFTLYVALFTVLLKGILTIYTRKVGNKTNNPSIIALAQDHRNDIFSASAVVVGITMSQLGYHWVDPWREPWWRWSSSEPVWASCAIQRMTSWIPSPGKRSMKKSKSLRSRCPA